MGGLRREVRRAREDAPGVRHARLRRGAVVVHDVAPVGAESAEGTDVRSVSWGLLGIVKGF